MPTLTLYNLGNADCCRMDLSDEQKILIDYADMRTDDEDDKRADLPKLLREDLNKSERDYYDVVAFTHLDEDHYKGSSDFFWLNHAKKYQADDRIKINTLWVPAAVITEDALKDEARVIQAEARHRLENNYGIRVFSRPKRLENWLKTKGLELRDREHLITDAGKLVPEYNNKNADYGVEFFIHSPHAKRLNENEVEDRNGDCLVFQARFCVDGYDTDVLMSGDAKHETWTEVIDITRHKGNDDRLHWAVYKLPHHCSYTAIGPDKYTDASPDKTPPTKQVAWLCENQSSNRCIVVSPSKPIPSKGSDEDDDQPPHRQAANYYKGDVVNPKDGKFLVTMEEPSVDKPEPIVITIDGNGAKRSSAGALGFAAITGTSSPRAGSQ